MTIQRFRYTKIAIVLLPLSAWLSVIWGMIVAISPFLILKDASISSLVSVVISILSGALIAAGGWISSWTLKEVLEAIVSVTEKINP